MIKPMVDTTGDKSYGQISQKNGQNLEQQMENGLKNLMLGTVETSLASDNNSSNINFSP